MNFYKFPSLYIIIEINDTGRENNDKYEFIHIEILDTENN